VEEYTGYVGLDVHKDTIAVAVAYPGRSKPKSVGIIANSKRTLLRLVGKRSPNGEVLGFCYEARSCGYEVYRWLKQTGVPSMNSIGVFFGPLETSGAAAAGSRTLRPASPRPALTAGRGATSLGKEDAAPRQ
jgi:hypothetical protein